MRLIDLTLPAQTTQDGHATFTLEERHHVARGVPFTGMVYHLRHNSMLSSYLDLPGHIKETDDGADTASYPLEKLYRVPAVVIHLDRASGSGPIGAEELAAHCPEGDAGVLILNALGKRRFDEIEVHSVYLTPEAAEWIVGRGVHLLVSDVYESHPKEGLQGCFNVLFANGVSTICYPINMHRIDRPRVLFTSLTMPLPGVTQLPCRALVEIEE